MTKKRRGSPARSALQAMLNGIETTTRLPYEAWAMEFWQRWRCQIVIDNEVKQRVNQYVAERELDLDEMTVLQAYGIFAHHPLKFLNEQHLADYVRDQEKIPMDTWQPLDNDDLNRIEHEEWLHERVKKTGIQIDMGRDL